jgi:hypothetical protein
VAKDLSFKWNSGKEVNPFAHAEGTQPLPTIRESKVGPFNAPGRRNQPQASKQVLGGGGLYLKKNNSGGVVLAHKNVY